MHVDDGYRQINMSILSLHHFEQVRSFLSMVVALDEYRRSLDHNRISVFAYRRTVSISLGFCIRRIWRCSLVFSSTKVTT